MDLARTSTMIPHIRGGSFWRVFESGSGAIFWSSLFWSIEQLSRGTRIGVWGIRTQCCGKDEAFLHSFIHGHAGGDGKCHGHDKAERAGEVEGAKSSMNSSTSDDRIPILTARLQCAPSLRFATHTRPSQYPALAPSSARQVTSFPPSSPTPSLLKNLFE
jgi:hypothetical protein